MWVESHPITLGTDEVVLGSVRARLPKPGTSVGSFIVVVAAVMAFDRARQSRRMDQLAEQYRAAGFPFTAHMVLVATTTRLVVVEAVGRDWSETREVGSIPRSDISSLTTPYIGNNPWKVARLDLRSGAWVKFRIDRDGAGAFLELFT